MHETTTSSSSSSEELLATKTSTTSTAKTKTANALTKKTKPPPTAGVGAAATTAETFSFIFHDKNPKTKALFFVGILSGIGNGLVRSEHRTFSLSFSFYLSVCLSISLSFLRRFIVVHPAHTLCCLSCLLITPSLFDSVFLVCLLCSVLLGLSGNCVDFFHVLFGYWCRHGKWARTNRDYVLLVYGHWV